MKNAITILTCLILLSSCEKKMSSDKLVADKKVSIPNKKKQYSYVSIKDIDNSTVVSDVFETFSDISEDERFKLMDEWTKKLNVKNFSSRDLLTFDSYSKASSDREMIIISNQKEAETVQSSDEDYYEPSLPNKASNNELISKMNDISMLHCTMEGDKHISFNSSSGYFSFGDTSFKLNDVYAVYEYKSDDYYSKHWLVFDCKSGDCIPGGRITVSGTLFAFDSKEAVDNFVSLFNSIKTY